MTRQGNIAKLPSLLEVEQARQKIHTEEQNKLHRGLCLVSESAERSLCLLRERMLQGETYIAVYYDKRYNASNPLFYTEGQEYEKLLIASRARRQDWEVKIEELRHDVAFTRLDEICIIYKITPLKETLDDDF